MTDVPAYSTTPAHNDVQDFVSIQLKFVFCQRQYQQVHVVQFVPKVTSGQSVQVFICIGLVLYTCDNLAAMLTL